MEVAIGICLTSRRVGLRWRMILAREEIAAGTPGCATKRLCVVIDLKRSRDSSQGRELRSADDQRRQDLSSAKMMLTIVDDSIAVEKAAPEALGIKLLLPELLRPTESAPFNYSIPLLLRLLFRASRFERYFRKACTSRCRMKHLLC